MQPTLSAYIVYVYQIMTCDTLGTLCMGFGSPAIFPNNACACYHKSFNISDHTEIPTVSLVESNYIRLLCLTNTDWSSLSLRGCREEAFATVTIQSPEYSKNKPPMDGLYCFL